jgi:hypothetical protein
LETGLITDVPFICKVERNVKINEFTSIISIHYN